MLVQPVQPVGQPCGADLQEGQAELGETLRDPLDHDAGELEHHPRREHVGMDLTEVLQGRAADLVGRVAVPVNAQRHAQLLGGLVHRIVDGVSQGRGQAQGEELEAHQALLGDGATKLLGGLLGLPQRQHTHGVDAVREGVVLLGEVGVAGPAHRRREAFLAQLGRVAGPAGEQDHLLHVLPVHDRKPDLHLLGRAQAALVPAFQGPEELGVPGLIATGPEGRWTLVPGGLQVLADVLLPFQQVPIAVKDRSVGHDPDSSPFFCNIRRESYLSSHTVDISKSAWVSTPGVGNPFTKER